MSGRIDLDFQQFRIFVPWIAYALEYGKSAWQIIWKLLRISFLRQQTRLIEDLPRHSEFYQNFLESCKTASIQPLLYWSVFSTFSIGSNLSFGSVSFRSLYSSTFLFSEYRKVIASYKHRLAAKHIFPWVILSLIPCIVVNNFFFVCTCTLKCFYGLRPDLCSLMIFEVK